MDWLGFPAGTPIVAGGVDAAGVTQAGHHVAMIGTSMCWGYINQTVDASHGLVSMPHIYNGKRDLYLYVFGGASTVGQCVAWYRDQFCQGEIEAAKKLPHGDPRRLLEDAAVRVAAGSDGVVFLPYG